MNRFQRRATAALDRKDSTGGTHANQSFQNLVAEANRDKLKPFILECVGELEKVLRQEMARQFLDALAPIQTRLMVLEKLAMDKLGETPESLAIRILDEEDAATGLTPVDDAAIAGDFLRVTANLKVDGQEKWSNPMNLNIRKLLTPRPNEGGEPVFDSYEELEKALVGARVGDVREVPVTIQNGEVKVSYLFKTKVDRISRNLADQALKAAQANAAAQTESASNV